MHSSHGVRIVAGIDRVDVRFKIVGHDQKIIGRVGMDSRSPRQGLMLMKDECLLPT